MDDLVGTAAQPASGMVDETPKIDAVYVARCVLRGEDASIGGLERERKVLALAVAALGDRFNNLAGFRLEIAKLINRYSLENGSDTPDFILAEYLAGCLSNFDDTLRAREKWYGRQVYGKVSQQVDGPPPEKAPGWVNHE